MQINVLCTSNKHSEGAGFVVDVFPQGVYDGPCPNCFVIHITGVPEKYGAETFDKVRHFLLYAPAIGDFEPEAEDASDACFPRAFRINPADVPLAVRNELLATGQYTITATQFYNYARRRITNATNYRDRTLDQFVQVAADDF